MKVVKNRAGSVKGQDPGREIVETDVVMVTSTLWRSRRRGENQARVAEIAGDPNPEIVEEPHEINLHRGIILEIV